MKHLLFSISYLVWLTATGQPPKSTLSVPVEDPTFIFTNPDGWRGERLSIPLDFAPQIPYKGIEELRFTPGWGDRTSASYWSYAYVWWLEGIVAIDADQLQKHVNAYYSGLVKRNLVKRSIDPAKIVETRTVLSKVPTAVPTEVAYKATITMLDYMAQVPITLTCFIRVIPCAEQGHTALIFTVSPQPMTHGIWTDLRAVEHSFSCH